MFYGKGLLALYPTLLISHPGLEPKMAELYRIGKKERTLSVIIMSHTKFSLFTISGCFHITEVK